MKRISRKLPFLTFLTLATGCAAYMSYFQSSFFSKFSLQELVQRSKAAGQLNCSTHAGGGGGGGGIGIGTGGGGLSPKQTNFSKSESFSCQLTDTEQFDEPKFIQVLKQNVESDLNSIKAKITSENLSAAGFYLEYSSGDISGRVEISGKIGQLNYYTLTADLQEKRGEAK